jgi:hypothetical protein
MADQDSTRKTSVKRDKQPDIELLRLQLEKEKWQAERAKSDRDFALREREQANRDAETNLKREEQAASKWRSPLTVAILAAAIAVIGNAGVAALNGWLQRNLDDTKRNAELSLEESKAESNRILEMIKTGNTEIAAKNIEFLLDTGLVADAKRVARLRKFLENRKPGTGPSLPAGSRFEVVPGDSLNRSVQAELQANLERYIAYLDSVGFPASTKKVVVRVKDDIHGNVMYVPGTGELWIGADVINDISGPLQQYGVSVLLDEGPAEGAVLGIKFGTADYLTASFLQNPKLGETIAKVAKPPKPYLRTMQNERKFTKPKANPDFPDHLDAGEIWGGLFWELRQRLTREKFDPILAKAWLSVKFPPNGSEAPKAFVSAILANAGGESVVKEIKDALVKRDFPTAN